MNRLGTGQALPQLVNHAKNHVQGPKKSAIKKNENKRKEDDEDYTENIEEGLARSQSLLRFEEGDRDANHFLAQEEMLSDLEDTENENLMRAQLMQALSELQIGDMSLVDELASGIGFTKTKGITRYLSLPFIALAYAKNKKAFVRLSNLAEAYSSYQNAVDDKSIAILTEELIEYSLSESAWQEVRAHRHSPSIRSIAIEKIRTYSLKHTISQRYCGSCFTLQVRSLEQKESSHDRDELVRLDAGQIKEALLAESPDREKLLGQISMQYICDQIVTKEGGFKFQAKLATAYRACAIIRPSLRGFSGSRKP